MLSKKKIYQSFFYNILKRNILCWLEFEIVSTESQMLVDSSEHVSWLR